MKQALLWIVIVIAVASLAANAFMYKKFSNHRALIVVNGEAIRQKDLEDRVDYLYAKELLSKMVWTKLVLQEAARRNCVPTDAEVTDAVHDIDRANPSVTYTARKTDPQLTLFRDAVRTNLALRNLQVVDVHVSDAEVAAFYRTHTDMFTLPAQTQATAVIAKDAVARDAARGMLAEGVAADVIAATPGVKVVGVNVGLAGQLPAPLSTKLLSLKPGDIGVFSLGQQYLIAKVVSVSPQHTLPLDQIRAKAEMETKLSRAPSQATIMVAIRRKANIYAVSDKYWDAIPPVAQGIPMPGH